MERATGLEPVLPTWEGNLSTLYFQHLQNRPIKICVHAAHTVHALPDLRIAGGRLGDVFYHALQAQLYREFVPLPSYPRTSAAPMS